MASFNQIGNIADDLTRYVRACGKRSILETKPFGAIKPDDLFFEPKLLDRIPVSMQKSMSYDEAITFAKQGKLKSFSAINSQVSIKIGEKDFAGKLIGHGGSKTAYRINSDGEDICVLLPNRNWNDALYEAENTQTLKKMGLITNDYCKIIPVEADGCRLPAIICKPYDKHSFKIFDSKNPNDVLDKYIDVKSLNEDNIQDFIKDLIEDAKTMTRHKIELGYDSYNLALINGKPRLYLNDLSYEPNEMFSSRDSVSILKHNISQAISALNAAFSWDATRINPFINKLDDCRWIDNLTEKFAIQVREKNGAIELLDGLGNRLSTAFLLKGSDRSMQILDIASDIKGKGYGTKLLDEIKKKYPDSEIQVAACWEELLSDRPPHKFYLDNGFVAKDKSVQAKLEAWIANGAKTSEFPRECDCAEMVFKSVS